MFIPKKILYVVGVIAILALCAFAGSWWRYGKLHQPPHSYIPTNVGMSEGEQATLSPVSTSAPTTPSSRNSAPESRLDIPPQTGGEEEEVKVVRVVDGDTIEVELNGKTERVRYIGIDTPETVDPRKPVQCFGVEASKKNKELVEGKMVRLEKDITDRDKYNRLLRYVYLKPQIDADTETRMNADNPDEIFVNLALVERGFASSYSYPPDIKYQERFVAAERHARENKLGLWRACSSSDSSAPMSSPQQHSYIPTNVGMSAAETSLTNSCPIKGNINASGEKIYHLRGCGSYAKTTIDERRGERWFCSESEAQSAGWRKALNCP